MMVGKLRALPLNLGFFIFSRSASQRLTGEALDNLQNGSTGVKPLIPPENKQFLLLFMLHSGQQ